MALRSFRPRVSRGLLAAGQVVRLHVRHDPGRGLIHQQGEDGLDVGDGRSGCGRRDRAFGLLRGFRFLRF